MCIGNERCTRNVNRRRYRAEAEAADDESYHHVGQQTASWTFSSSIFKAIAASAFTPTHSIAFYTCVDGNVLASRGVM